MLDTVRVPAEFEPIFEKAQEYVSCYFGEKREDPTRGMIEIFGERYILVRAASMSVDFFDSVRNMYSDRGEREAIDIARSMLFDIAHTVGKMDARNFHKMMDLQDPIERLSAGPVHFAHAGWAFVDILPESRPSPGEDFCLIYEHPFSFESDAWARAGRKTDFPVCVMSAGYSSGWCEESFGISLVSCEILCKAKGDEVCRFVMAHPSRIQQYIEEYFEMTPDISAHVSDYQIPGFFERKWMEEKLRQSEATYQTIFDEANDAIFVHDIDTGEILEVNKRMCSMFGYKPEEAVGMPVGRLSVGYAPYSQADALDWIRKAGEEGPQVFEWESRDKNGRIFWTEVNLKVARIKGINRVLAVVRDITERKEAADAFLAAKNETDRINKRLEQAIGHAEQLAEQAHMASEAKGQFLANMSHEIRTPMNAIVGFSDLLAEEDLSDEQQEYVDIIRSSADGLLSLINDILDFSKVEAGKLDVEVVNCSLRDIVSSVDNMVRFDAETKGLVFEVSCADDLPDEIVTDPDRLRQCLVNIVSNAVKFTERGYVSMDVRSVSEGGVGYIRFDVEDTGIGIPSDKLKDIFGAFVQADGSASRRFGGTGLGLGITRRIAEMLGGRVAVKSQEARGSTFSLLIPRYSPISHSMKYPERTPETE